MKLRLALAVLAYHAGWWPQERTDTLASITYLHGRRPAARKSGRRTVTCPAPTQRSRNSHEHR